MINLATLTGAILVALGTERAGVFSNNDKLAGQIADASETTKEKTWRLPLGPEYDRLLDSPNADMNRHDPRETTFGTGFGARLLNRWIADNFEG